MKDVTVSSNVVYYKNCDRNQVPVAAIVTRVNPGNRLNVSLFLDGGGEPVFKRSVRHIDDPFFKDHPERARVEGGWDFPKVRGEVVSVSEQRDQFEPAAPKGVLADHVEKLSKDFKKQEVFNKVRSKGVTMAQLEAIYRDRQLTEPAAV